jgi:hypothetical protein
MAGATWDVQTGTVGSITVTGVVQDSTLKSDQGVGKLTFGRLIDSDIYAGVFDSFAALAGSDGLLPAAAGDFDAMGVGSLTITGLKGAPAGAADFANSVVAAWNIGNVTVSSANFHNGGTLFGLATHSLSKITVKAGAFSRGRLAGPGTAVSSDDFRILLL